MNKIKMESHQPRDFMNVKSVMTRFYTKEPNFQECINKASEKCRNE